MMRFYGITDRDVLAMPFSRLLLLYQQIDMLEAEEEMHMLVTYHTGDPKDRLETLQRLVHDQQRNPRPQGKTTEQLMESPGTRLVAKYVDSEEILAERERQRLADEQRRAAWEARNPV